MLPLAEVLFHAFGPHAIGAVTNVYFLVKGIVVHLMQAIMLPLFQVVFKASQGEYQNYINIALMAWGAKPVVGLLSDVVPIAGFHKRTYMLLAALMSASACLAITGTTTASTGNFTGAKAAAAFFFVVNLGCATLDLLTEGKYSELMVTRPETGSSLVSWAWGCAMVGGAIAAVFEGPMADAGAGTIRAVLLTAGGILVVSMWPIFNNWFSEPRAGPRDAVMLKLKGHGRIVGYGIAMSIGSVSLAVIALLFGRGAQLVAVFINVVLLSSLSFYCLPPIIAKANLYMFLKEALYVQIPGPLDFFFTAGPACIAGGPAFSYTYYQTFTAIVGYITGGVGVWLFHRVFSTRSFRTVFLCTTAVKILSSVFDIVMVERWNVRAGIPDKLFYFLGDAIISSACGMLDFMPAVVLTSKLCTKGLESTLYAIMAGYSNFGQTVARSVGYYLATEVFVVKLDPEAAATATSEAGRRAACDHSQLSTLIFVAHLALPLLSIPLVFILVPNKRLTEALIDDETSDIRADPEVAVATDRKSVV